MKCLVKKYGVNASKKELEEVYIQSAWHDWIDAEGKPLTDENYGYALCENCPDDVELAVDDFDVLEGSKEIEDKMGEKKTVKYWTANYIGGGQ